MGSKLVENSRNVLRSSLALKKEETLLIVTDDSKKELAEALYAAGRSIGSETLLLVMQDREKSGQEPPSGVTEAMKHCDVAVCITEHSLTHTQAKKDAVAAGVRVATMPGITYDMFLEGAISADYDTVEKMTFEVTEKLSQSKQVIIRKDGEELSFSIQGRSGVPSTGIYREKGQSGNLPSGEAFIAPLEGTASGRIWIDGSISGLGKLDEPILLTMEEGSLTAATGRQGEMLLQLLGNGDGRNVAEFGVGTNEKARITGNVLEDEKVYGTIHIAFGSNNTFGGTIAAGVHIDCVVKAPTVYLDEALLLEEGHMKRS
ncbi:aminopeptidase [Terribacillus saccharophilus]|uniref:Aminopeptidase n=1 Tax=Terribacillus saccharophilus TaxID=361277 RepID=A0ABX4GXC4_9BACI|nr:aminopeptidase [Terribacillus saccharophilus]PAD35383.1 aminopeptidase [Terribacillus saccharophilus]PAD96138.1 aminopeptidase [Terribacillus saccharophilus]PAD99526.1 aminopeptidase [Terribacillus saccharophilus]